MVHDYARGALLCRQRVDIYLIRHDVEWPSLLGHELTQYALDPRLDIFLDARLAKRIDAQCPMPWFGDQFLFFWCRRYTTWARRQALVEQRTLCIGVQK